jgi:hypothetical protein
MFERKYSTFILDMSFFPAHLQSDRSNAVNSVKKYHSIPIGIRIDSLNSVIKNIEIKSKNADGMIFRPACQLKNFCRSDEMVGKEKLFDADMYNFLKAKYLPKLYPMSI